MELLEKTVLSESQIQKIENGGFVTIEASWDETMSVKLNDIFDKIDVFL